MQINPTIYLFLLLPQLLMSQPDYTDFAPVGAVWSNPVSGQYMEVTKDTMLGGVMARKVEKFWECYNPWQDKLCDTEDEQIVWNNAIAPEFLHMDGNKVYHWVVDSFYLLYDFDLEVGSVYEVVSKKSILYPNEKMSFQVTIRDRDRIDLGGHSLVAQRLGVYGDRFPLADGYNFVGWIFQKLGKDRYVFPYDGADEDIFGFPFVAQCYSDEGFNYSAHDFCMLVSQTNYSLVPVVKVFPNPTSDLLYIESNSGSSMGLVFSDMYGKIIRRQSVRHGEQISVSSLSKGMYSLTILGEGGIYSEKVIIQ